MTEMEFFREYRWFIERLILFVGILVPAGIFARLLLRNIVFAFEPSAKGDVNVRNKGIRVWLALADLAGWLFAFLIAAEVVGLGLAMKFFTALILIVAVAVVGVTITGLVAWSLNKEASELILSIIGYWYLKPRRSKPLDPRPYDLGDGKQGTISEIALLHVTFKLKEGGTETRSTAFLIRYLWGQSRKTWSEKASIAG